MISTPFQSARPASEDVRFSFRELRTAQEMRDSLALRYRVFSAIAAHSTPDHSSRLDVDAYDSYSRHFVLLARSGGRESVVGTLRLAGETPSPQLAYLHAVSAAHPTVAPRLGALRVGTLPMLSYLEEAAAIAAYVSAKAGAGERVVEASRFCVDPRLLAAMGRRGLRLSQHVVLSAITFACHVDPVDRVLVDARRSAPFLERLYRSFGFERSVSLPKLVHSEDGQPYVLLEATPASVPAPLKPQIASLANQLCVTGEAILREVASPDRKGGQVRAVDSARVGSIPIPAHIAA